MMNKTLENFKEYLKRIKKYEQASALISWDLQTAAPKKSLEGKLEALGFFSTEAFRLSTAECYGDMLSELSRPEIFDTLDDGMKVTVRRGYRDFQRFQRVPQDFYTEYVTTSGRSEKVWEEAKLANDFRIFAPSLDKIIAMTKEYVGYMEPDKDPYEVLLDMYEEGMDSVTIDGIFAELKEGLIPLLDKIRAAGRPDLSALEGTYDIDAQKKVQNLLLSYIGFDFDAGGTAESAHPFTATLCRGDIRVTNHYHETHPISSIFSAIHEGGHAIFEQNIDSSLADTAAETVNLMGLHESQSRFYENILGRRPAFWIPIYGKLGGLLPQFKEVPFDTFCRAINDVHPSYIRTEADELTYCLHIMVRYELEKQMFAGTITAHDLPAAWNRLYKEYLGVDVPSDREGVLQDSHWANGNIGYFPSYAIGSAYGAQYLLEMQKDLDVEAAVRSGKLTAINRWLEEKIWKYGCMKDPVALFESVCGPFRPEEYVAYLEKKFTEIYEL